MSSARGEPDARCDGRAQGVNSRVMPDNPAAEFYEQQLLPCGRWRGNITYLVDTNQNLAASVDTIRMAIKSGRAGLAEVEER